MTEKPRCKAIKAGGGRCSNRAQPGQDYCWSHSRETAEQRREYARAGGYARSRRSPDELERIKGHVETIAANVLTGHVDRGTAAVLGQLYNVLLRTIELQRKLDRQQLEDEVAELREMVRDARRIRWGG